MPGAGEVEVTGKHDVNSTTGQTYKSGVQVENYFI